MPASFAQFLPQFGLEGIEVPRAVPVFVRDHGRTAAVDQQHIEAARIAEAEERGRIAGEELARIRYEAILDGVRSDCDRRLAEQVHETELRSGKVIAEQIETGLAALEEAIAGPVASVLRRLLGGAARQRAADELSEVIGFLLRSHEAAARIRITGPADLLQGIKSRLAAGSDQYEFVEDDRRVDIAVSVDSTVIETRIGAWENSVAAATVDPNHE